MQKLLQNEETRLFILKSSLIELESMGEKAAASTQFARTFCEIVDDEYTIGGDSDERICKFMSKSNQKSSLVKIFLI